MSNLESSTMVCTLLDDKKENEQEIKWLWEGLWGEQEVYDRVDMLVKKILGECPSLVS